jgi:hypothetical protein
MAKLHECNAFTVHRGSHAHRILTSLGPCLFFKDFRSNLEQQGVGGL